MNKIHRTYVVLILSFAILNGSGNTCSGRAQETFISGKPNRVWVIQVAASKEFIDPDFFEQKFNTSENIGYFEKDGWFKYYIGGWKTEAEAARNLSGFKFGGFVTSYFPAGSLAEAPAVNANSPSSAGDTGEKQAVNPDTITLDQIDTTAVVSSEDELRQLYNLKIRQGDSAFNVEKNLLLARRLYQEASVMQPERNYPRDQIVEIDKLLTQSQPKSFLSRWTLEIYVISGLVLALVIGLVVYLLVPRRRLVTGSDASQDAEPDKTPVIESLLEKLGSQVFSLPDQSQQDEIKVLTRLILPVSPGLSDEILTRFTEPLTDYPAVRTEIERCLNSTDEILRMESELALIRLHPDDPFRFLDLLKQDFTPFEQLHVIEMVRRNRISLPDFSRWLNSPNPAVASFCRTMLERHPIIELPGIPPIDIQSAALHLLRTRLPQP